MELTLEIYILVNRDRSCNYYSKGICELNYTCFRYRKNGEEGWNIEKFPIWNVIQIEVKDEIKINDDEFYEVGITPKSYIKFCVYKNDIQKLNKFCDNRNQELLFNKENVYNYIDDEVLDIAENLLNIAEENIMLNYHVIGMCHLHYSHIISQTHIENPHDYKFYYNFLKDSDCLKGKEKKEAEKFNDETLKNFRGFSKIIDNFVEIITEEKKVNPHIAKAIAWECIQRKTIEYYAQKWLEEYESNLAESFNDLCAQCINIDNSQIRNTIKRNYIKSVLLCDEIDIENSKEILMYFLLSKSNIKELILYEFFSEHYKIINELKQSINSSDIKQKLKTKQKRKITKYTIDDIDLMNGSEFENFVSLLFKKMGYSSQVTKKSGDQGLDVIATKNGTKIGTQAKCYSNTVGNAAIQEAVAGKKFYRCDKVIVITNNYFTPAAIQLAKSNDVVLWNRDMLKEKIKELF